MQQGVITEDNFSQILAPLSKRRQSGVLEIISGPERFSFFIEKGKIVDVLSDAEHGPRGALKELLRRADITCELEEELQGYAEVVELYAKNTESDPGEARAIVAEYVQKLFHETLYTFSPRAGALYSFRMQSVAFDPDIQPALPLNQYLLELSEREQKLEAGEVVEKEAPRKESVDVTEAVDPTVGEGSPEDIVSLLDEVIDQSFQIDPIQATDFLDQAAEEVSEPEVVQQEEEQAEDPEPSEEEYRQFSPIQAANNTLLYSERIPRFVLAVALVMFLFYAFIEWEPVFHFLGRV